MSQISVLQIVLLPVRFRYFPKRSKEYLMIKKKICYSDFVRSFALHRSTISGIERIYFIELQYIHLALTKRSFQSYIHFSKSVS